MEIKHFYPSNPELRFFKVIQDKMTSLGLNYKHYANHKTYINDHESRIDEHDLTLITSHGGHNSIITFDEKNKPVKLISTEQSTIFRNNIVIAFACETLMTLADESIKNGAISYFGMKDQFSRLFVFGDKVESVGKFANRMKLLGKKIFVESFSNTLLIYIKNPLTFEKFVDLVKYNIERELVNLSEMSSGEINSKYGLSIPKNKYDLFQAEVVISLRDIYNSVYNIIDWKGESKAISALSLNLLSDQQLIDFISTYKVEKKEYRYFEYYLKLLAAKKAGMNHDEKKYVDLLKNELQNLKIKLNYE